jgi:hypothetical protein
MLPSAYRTLLAPNKIEADVLGGQPTDPPHVQCFVPSGSSPGRASPIINGFLCVSSSHMNSVRLSCRNLRAVAAAARGIGWVNLFGLVCFGVAHTQTHGRRHHRRQGPRQVTNGG